MSVQPMLFECSAPPEPPPGIDLRCCDVEDVLAEIEANGSRVALAVADPPWLYDQSFGESRADDHYDVLTIEQIISHLERCAALSPRLALWHVWPVLMADWPSSLPGWGRPKTGGAWSKSGPAGSGHYGQGYHWAGCSEPVLVYTKKGACTDRSQKLRNSWVEPPAPHSRKPVGWMRQWLRRWTRPGDTVLDLYAGLGSVAEACFLEDRLYIGAEIDAGRHAEALSLLARARAVKEMGL